MTNHIHKYKKVKIGRNKDYVVWQCQLNCSHYQRQEFLPGKITICWRCGKEFELTKALIKAKPTCRGCIQTKNTVKTPDDAVSRILGLK